MSKLAPDDKSVPIQVHFLMRLYGIAITVIAFTLIAVALSAHFHGLRISFHNGPATLVEFGAFCLLLLPAIHTYGTYGIAEDADPGSFDIPDPEVVRRFRVMEARFPYSNLLENSAYASIGIVVVVSLILPNSVDPFMFFCGAICFLGAIWTVFGLPSAVTALSPLSFDDRLSRIIERADQIGE